MSFNKEIVSYNSHVYIVVRKFKDHPNFPVAEAKEHYSCDTVLRKDGILYVCQIIEETQVIENE